MASSDVHPLVANPRQRSVALLDAPPRPEPTPRALAVIHADAARMDGMVKLLIGLVFVVLSLGLMVAGAVGLYALIHQQQVRIWALVLGVPGLLMTVAGVGLMLVGAWKLLSGRGRG